MLYTTRGGALPSETRRRSLEVVTQNRTPEWMARRTQLVSLKSGDFVNHDRHVRQRCCLFGGLRGGRIGRYETESNEMQKKSSLKEQMANIIFQKV
jgi:hypothetical protein